VDLQPILGNEGEILRCTKMSQEKKRNRKEVKRREKKRKEEKTRENKRKQEKTREKKRKEEKRREKKRKEEKRREKKRKEEKRRDKKKELKRGTKGIYFLTRNNKCQKRRFVRSSFPLRATLLLCTWGFQV
jgi:hypothetical protein